MYSDVSYYSSRLFIFACGFVLFLGLLCASIVGLVMSSITYSNYQSTITSADCNVTSCVASEGPCGIYSCFVRQWEFTLNYLNVTYDTPFIESSRDSLEPCPSDNSTILCYFDTTNINGTLTLEKLVDFTRDDALTNIIISVCGIVLCVILVLVLGCATVVMCQRYREAKRSQRHEREHPTG